MPELDQNRINEILNISRNIQGWRNSVGGALLYVIGLLYAPNNIFVELGSWKGTSTVWLANALKDKKVNRGGFRRYMGRQSRRGATQRIIKKLRTEPVIL